jgi:cobalamin biosynthesis protein CbiG
LETAITDHRTFEHKTVTTDTNAAPSSTTQTLEKGVHHGDEEAGGTVAGGIGGALVGAVVGGPVGAVIGGAVGAASGATAGALDDKRKDEAVVVTKEEKTW